MLEKFSEEARRVVTDAHEEASRFGSTVIQTEHLLLGLIREDVGLTNRLNLTADEIRNDLKIRAPIRVKVPASGDLPLSEQSRSALNKAADLSDRLSDEHVTTEHILFGLLAEHRSTAAEILREHGIRLEIPRRPQD
jgi:ATP-dependent Clp protease ATP-binding subunit ClpC